MNCINHKVIGLYGNNQSTNNTYHCMASTNCFSPTLISYTNFPFPLKQSLNGMIQVSAVNLHGTIYKSLLV